MSNLLSIAHATSCQVYPSEYAYHESVNRVESASANVTVGGIQLVSYEEVRIWEITSTVMAYNSN